MCRYCFDRDLPDGWATFVEGARAAYLQRGAPNGPLCVSKTCLLLATERVFWPVPAGEAFPVYCPTCAAWAKEIMMTLGGSVHSEALPPPSGDVRGIDLGGAL